MNHGVAYTPQRQGSPHLPLLCCFQPESRGLIPQPRSRFTSAVQARCPSEELRVARPSGDTCWLHQSGKSSPPQLGPGGEAMKTTSWGAQIKPDTLLNPRNLLLPPA